MVATLKIFQKSYSKSFSSLERFLFRFCEILRPKADLKETDFLDFSVVVPHVPFGKEVIGSEVDEQR